VLTILPCLFDILMVVVLRCSNSFSKNFTCISEAKLASTGYLHGYFAV
jgi:hypothetical protein